MIYRDYHHHRIDEALSDAEHVISQVRLQGNEEQAEFVTGFGVIRKELFELLERYSLQPAYKLNNQGAIIVIIE